MSIEDVASGREHGERSELYDAEGVGFLLSLSGRTIKRWADEGKFPLPAISDGRFVRWTWSQVKEWMEDQKRKTVVA